MGGGRDYDIRLDDKTGAWPRIDVPSEIVVREPWFNQTLTNVNDAAATTLTLALGSQSTCP